MRDLILWICDGMQKYMIFEHEMPKKPHILQNYITFAESFGNDVNVM